MTCCSRRWRQDGALSGHPGPKEAGVIGGSLSRSEGELPITHNNKIFPYYFLVLVKDILSLAVALRFVYVHAERGRGVGDIKIDGYSTK